MPPLPKRIRSLPVDKRGYPVPWFVSWVKGEPEFRVADSAKLPLAIKERRCWVCGGPLGSKMTFVIGPMCSINRISAEPPNHGECADFAARACPFLARPQMRRREGGLPAEIEPAPGLAILRNPGVTCLWTTLDYKLVRAANGVLFHIGSPLKVRWYAGARAATRAEVLSSIESGLPTLQQMASAQGPGAFAALEDMRRAAMVYLPAHGGAE